MDKRAGEKKREGEGGIAALSSTSQSATAEAG